MPALVIQTGSSGCTGAGKIAHRPLLADPVGNSTCSPRHSRRTVSIVSTITLAARRRSSPAASTKSVACQPDANETPTRPLDRLSTTDHSSAMRTGWCSGATTLPARTPTRSVTAATAAPVTAGFGYRPPNEWKWRSGVQTAAKPLASANRALSSSRR